MNHRSLWWVAMAGVVTLVSPAVGEPASVDPAAVDPDDLAAMLTDLEASGGILTAADLAMLQPPARGRTRGSWALALGTRHGAGPRVAARAEIAGPWWSGRIRARRDDRGDAMVGWIEARHTGWMVQAGGGAPCLGMGLLAAPAGARSSLSTEASLTVTRHGWRPTVSLDSARGLLGVVASWRTRGVSVGAGTARDRDGRSVIHGRAGIAAGPSRIGVLAGQWDRCRGLVANAAWQEGSWFAAVEGAAWQRDDGAAVERAWLLGAGWRGERWRAEVQAGAAQAVSAPPSGMRPACLPGWRGGGWALRLAGQPAAGWSAGLMLGDGEERDPDAARGGRRRRRLAGLRIRRGGRGEPVWEFRWRRADESRWSWNTQEPWRPASLTSRRLRTWLAVSVDVPLGTDVAGLAWHGLEEAGGRRQLVTARWEGRRGGVNWRGALQSAWGEPLDLVAVAAPIPALVRLRHWGYWQRSAWFGALGRGRWRWQLGVELRQPTSGTGADAVVEVQSELGWGF